MSTDGTSELQYNTDFHREKYDPKETLEFSVTGNRTDFTPRYYPKDVDVSKARDLTREKGICLGEHVNDVGSKNREVSIRGYVISPELEELHGMLNLGNKYNLVCMQWQGEVLLAKSSIKGPYGVDVETRHWMYEYTLEFVSTGASETPSNLNGIRDTGNSLDNYKNDDGTTVGDDSGIVSSGL